MMKNILLSLILLSALNFNCYSQNWLWAQTANGGGQTNAVYTDADGNVFVSGTFADYITFGSTTLTTTEVSNVFLVKYDPDGNALWAKNIGGENNPAICVDASGNIFVTGAFSRPTINIGTITLTNAGGNNPGSAGGPGWPCTDMFIAKCDADGNVLWAKSAGGTDNEWGASVSADANGNVFVTGSFASASVNFGLITLINSSSSGEQRNLFITKYDANGNVLWAKGAAGDDANAYGNEGTSLSTDPNGNVFLTGEFWGHATFDTTILTTDGSSMFLAKYDGNGNILWAKGVGTGRSRGSSVTADVNGNAIVTGWFGDPTVIFGTFTLTRRGLFVTKYSPDGEVLWAKDANGIGQGNSISSDENGNVFVTGMFAETSMTFDPITVDYPVADCSPDYCFPIYIVNYDANGNVLCASALATGGAGGAGVAADNYGNAYLAGGFQISSFIIGTDTLPLTMGESLFVAKYSCDNTVSVTDASPMLSMTISPNPTPGPFTITLPATTRNTSICIYDVLGNCLLNKYYENTTSPAIDLSSQSKGVYFVEVVYEGERTVKKIVVQ